MATAKQHLRVFHKRHGRQSNSQPKGVAINRKSVGIIYINGHPYIYRADLVYHGVTPTLEQQMEDYERKYHRPGRRIIVVRRR